MTSEAHQLPVPQRPIRQGTVIRVQPPGRALAVRPALALIASRALPALTATVAAAATVLTAERAVRGLVGQLTPAASVTPPPAIDSTRRTVLTEWLTIERRRRAR